MTWAGGRCPTDWTTQVSPGYFLLLITTLTKIYRVWFKKHLYYYHHYYYYLHFAKELKLREKKWFGSNYTDTSKWLEDLNSVPMTPNSVIFLNILFIYQNETLHSWNLSFIHSFIPVSSQEILKTYYMLVTILSPWENKKNTNTCFR